MDEQIRFIPEEEYNNLILCKNQWHMLISELDTISKKLYNKPYYEGPFAINVAFEQIHDMYEEIEYLRLPWYKKL